MGSPHSRGVTALNINLSAICRADSKRGRTDLQLITPIPLCNSIMSHY